MLPLIFVGWRVYSILHNLSIAFVCLWLVLADEQNRIIEAGGWVESNRVNGEYGRVTIM